MLCTSPCCAFAHLHHVVTHTLCVKMETTDNDVCELGGSPGPVSPKNHQLKSPLSSQRKAAISLNRLMSSIA